MINTCTCAKLAGVIHLERGTDVLKHRCRVIVRWNYETGEISLKVTNLQGTGLGLSTIQSTASIPLLADTARDAVLEARNWVDGSQFKRTLIEYSKISEDN